MGKRRVHMWVSGHVQGVFFRASTRDEARRLGLTGWVRNLPDGRVELVAEGPEDVVEDLINWCRKGPSFARVDRVDVQAEEFKGAYTGFDVRYAFGVVGGL